TSRATATSPISRAPATKLRWPKGANRARSSSSTLRPKPCARARPRGGMPLRSASPHFSSNRVTVFRKRIDSPRLAFKIASSKITAQRSCRVLSRLTTMSAQNEWQRTSAIFVAALLLFETLTGLALWFPPFSIPNQVAVLLHTAAGVILLVPYAYYQARHRWMYRKRPLNPIKLTGYLGMGATSVALV